MRDKKCHKEVPVEVKISKIRRKIGCAKVKTRKMHKGARKTKECDEENN